MELKKEIFRSYDIRGIYPDELDDESAKEIVLLFLSLISKRANKNPEDIHIVIARDIRNSSQKLVDITRDALISKGVKVDDTGLMAVDAVYFAVGKFDYDGGIMITASHNPGAYGGYKMVSKGVEVIRGTDLWEHRGEKIDFKDSDKGELKNLDIWQGYLDHIFSFVDKEKIKPMKVVVDSGNGMAGIMIPKIMERLPQIELIPMFFEPDGNFPNRDPNPLIKGAADKLSEKVKQEKADIGFIFDADADRMFLVDENGNFLKGDDVLLVLTKQILERNPGAGIVYNLICSKNVKEAITKMRGEPIRSEVGYVNISKHMRERGGVMGGEISGHFSFKDNYYADSGFIAFLIVLQVMSEQGFKLSEFIKKYKNWHRGNEINLEVDDIPSKLDLIGEHYKDNIFDKIDGITVEFKDWWFNVRPSNTEPLLRITVETKDEANIKEKQEEIMEVLGVLKGD